MKKAFIIIAAVIAIVIAIWFFTRKKSATNSGGGGSGNDIQPEPVKNPPQQQATSLFVDSGPGLIEVTARIRTLTESGEHNRQAANIAPGTMFAGVSGPTFASTMGGLANIGFPLSAGSLRAVNDAISASDAGNAKQVMQTMQRINLSFKENGLPAFLPYEYEGGGEKNFYKNFICPNYGDCPRNWDLHKNSQRFPDAGRLAVADMKKVASNILAINTQLNELVRKKAIQDLVDAGWKFVGYSAP